jgi:hypothetical protein
VSKKTVPLLVSATIWPLSLIAVAWSRAIPEPGGIRSLRCSTPLLQTAAPVLELPTITVLLLIAAAVKLEPRSFILPPL